jgi:hypothetical protein
VLATDRNPTTDPSDGSARTAIERTPRASSVLDGRSEVGVWCRKDLGQAGPWFWPSSRAGRSPLQGRIGQPEVAVTGEGRVFRARRKINRLTFHANEIFISG